MPFIPRLTELKPEITAWRRDFHQHPEILYETHRTSGIVADKLREFGCDSIKTGIGRTGVVGVIKGKTSNSNKAVGLRADMDALPMTEDTGLPYASREAGKMHACGHDGHTSMLLGAAKYLTESRNFDGTTGVIFQPAEEGGGGGREMCADGLMDEFGIQEIYGMHNMPDLPIGQFAIRPGAFFAATDTFEIDVVGLGGHAAKPHEAIDTTLVASHIVVALQSVASRNADPLKPLVVSVTSFQTESQAFNVIPERVKLRGTIRTMDADIRAMAKDRIRSVSEQTAKAFGATANVTLDLGYPVMSNAPQQTEFAAQVASKIVGSENVTTDTPAIMGGEDFAFMLEERPGAYILVGNGSTPMVHHPKYNFNDEALIYGATYWARLIETAMPLS